MRRDRDELALILADGGDDEALRQRAAVDSALAARVEEYRRLLGALEHSRQAVPPLPDHLARWARAWLDTSLPEGRSVISRILDVLATNAPAPAVRNGHAGGSAVLYGDEAFHLDLRVEPSDGGRHRLRGQLIRLDEPVCGSWTVTVVSGDGAVRTTTTNACGEFAFDDLCVTAGTGLVATGDSHRLVVPRLEELEQDRA